MPRITNKVYFIYHPTLNPLFFQDYVKLTEEMEEKTMQNNAAAVDTLDKANTALNTDAKNNIDVSERKFSFFQQYILDRKKKKNRNCCF